MSWFDLDKTDIYCRYCQRNGEFVYLTCTNEGGYESRCQGYICNNCVIDDDPRTFQQNCASCEEIFYQSQMPEMCDICVAMLCQHCVDNKRYYKCFKCNYRICKHCYKYNLYKNEAHPTWCQHDILKKSKCQYHDVKDRFGRSRQCKHNVKPSQKFCKQHRYQHRRRIYKKK